MTGIFSSYYRLFFLFCIPLIVSGCKELTLERPNIPLTWGIRIDATTDSATLYSNLAFLEIQAEKALTVELSLTLDSAKALSLPQKTQQNWLRIQRICHTSKTPIYLSLSYTDPKNPFSPAPILSITQFHHLITHLLNRPEQVKKLIIPLSNFEQKAYDSLAILLPQLRQQFRISTSFSLPASDALTFPHWEASSEIAIQYLPVSTPAKPHYREINPKISQLAKQYNKPIFIAEANLLGTNKLNLLKNQFRFWSSEITVSGYTINTIYPVIAALDSSSYYGLYKERQLLQWIADYRQ